MNEAQRANVEKWKNTKPPITPEVLDANGKSLVQPVVRTPTGAASDEVFTYGGHADGLEDYVVQHTPRGDAHHLERMMAAGQQCDQAARATLAYLGYTYEGGEQWKPPLTAGLSDYERGHEAGTLQLLARLRDLMTLWSGVHPSKLSIESILTESQR